MSGGQVSVPMVLTTAVGGTYNDAAQHSQTLYGTFAHLPGMKVVVPSTARDAKGLMHAAIRDDDPVVYMFHKRLMGLGWMPAPEGPKTEVPEEEYEAPSERPTSNARGVTSPSSRSASTSTARSPPPRTSQTTASTPRSWTSDRSSPRPRDGPRLGAEDGPSRRRRRGLPLIRRLRGDRGAGRRARLRRARSAPGARRQSRRAGALRSPLEEEFNPSTGDISDAVHRLTE